MKRLCAIEPCLLYGSRILCKAFATNFTNLFINSFFFQSYQYNGRVIAKDCVQWNPGFGIRMFRNGVV